MDMNELTAAIVGSLRNAVRPGVNIATSFVKSQANGLAMQAVTITQARITGQINEAQFKVFNRQLAALTKNFVLSLAHLFLITFQQAWNAVVDVLWGRINQALDAAGLANLPIPRAGAV